MVSSDNRGSPLHNKAVTYVLWGFFSPPEGSPLHGLAESGEGGLAVAKATNTFLVRSYVQ